MEPEEEAGPREKEPASGQGILGRDEERGWGWRGPSGREQRGWQGALGIELWNLPWHRLIIMQIAQEKHRNSQSPLLGSEPQSPRMHPKSCSDSGWIRGVLPEEEVSHQPLPKEEWAERKCNVRALGGGWGGKGSCHRHPR